jgi:hypothetical protein
MNHYVSSTISLEQHIIFRELVCGDDVEGERYLLSIFGVMD